MARRILIRMAAIVVVLALLIVACGPAPTPEVIEKVVKETVVVEKEVEVTKVVEKEVVVTASPEPGMVTFVSWAEEEFEQEAIEKMLEAFEADTGVTVEFIIVTSGGTHSGGAP